VDKERYDELDALIREALRRNPRDARTDPAVARLLALLPIEEGAEAELRRAIADASAVAGEQPEAYHAALWRAHELLVRAQYGEPPPGGAER